jgi:hypothetical protein
VARGGHRCFEATPEIIRADLVKNVRSVRDPAVCQICADGGFEPEADLALNAQSGRCARKGNRIFWRALLFERSLTSVSS